jgi:hypothetical protein
LPPSGYRMSLCKFRITKATIALFLEENRHVARTVLEGSIVEVDKQLLQDDQLVDVRWEEKTVMMFTQDIRSRGEEVD